MAKESFKEQFEGQGPDEEVLQMFRKHPVVMRKGLVISAAGLLVGPLLTTVLASDFGMRVFKMETPPTMGFFFGSLLLSFVLGAILFFPSWMSWYFSIYLVTNQRFIQVYQKGFFHKSVADTPLSQIQSVNYEVSGIQETLLGFGTIVVQTYLGDIVMHEMHHPAHTSRLITDVLREQGIETADYPATQEAKENER